ncbi:hypothetical protein [Streptomyces sp. NPDC058394]|uniref:hypothetical protein n=1 Tax=Streptomyces sp. NPDC058394 TaxID=3346477 RepID=UPI003648F1AC
MRRSALPTCRPAPRRTTALRTAALAAALAAALTPGILTCVAYAHAPSAQASTSLPTVECEPDDQACKDREANEKEAKEIEEQQKKNQEAAAQADKDIKAVGDEMKECKPGSASCMEKLTAGKGEREEGGISDMTGTIGSFQPDPSDNAASAVSSTCAEFPGSLPEGAADDNAAPFPASQLCSLLGS